MPLYGNELADDITPLEAGLGWAVKLDKGDFVGRDKIAAMKESGPPREPSVSVIERSGSPRSHYDVHVDGREVGYVTSGAMSPTFDENIGLGAWSSGYRRCRQATRHHYSRSAGRGRASQDAVLQTRRSSSN